MILLFICIIYSKEFGYCDVYVVEWMYVGVGLISFLGRAADSCGLLPGLYPVVLQVV